MLRDNLLVKPYLFTVFVKVFASECVCWSNLKEQLGQRDSVRERKKSELKGLVIRTV